MYTKFLLCSAITIVVPCLVNDNRTQSQHICKVKVKMTGWHVSSMMNMMTKYEKHIIMITNKRHTTNLTNFNKVNGPWIQGQDREQEICTLHDEYWEEWCMVTLTFDTGDIYTGKVTRLSRFMQVTWQARHENDFSIKQIYHPITRVKHALILIITLT